MNSIKSIKWGAAVLFVFSAIYLGYELAFNSRIVDGVSGGLSSSHLLAFELEGRILSGIGFTLLLLRYFKLGGSARQIRRTALICILGFFCMFTGQKLFIDYLVDNSTESERIDAQYIALLKKGILTNSVRLDDIQIPASEIDKPATKAMVVIVGAMVFHSAQFIDQLKQSSSHLIDQAAENDARKSWPESYQRYQQYQQMVIDSWLQYENATQQYHSARDQALTKAALAADDIYISAAQSWREKTQQLDKQQLIQRSLEIKRTVSDYFEAKQKTHKYCDNRELLEKKCQIKLEQAYRDTVLKEAGRYVAPDYWCYPAREEKVTKTINGRSHTRVETVQDCDSMNRKWFERKLVNLITDGKNATHFSEDSSVADKVRSELKKHGITLSPSWRLKDKNTLISALSANAFLEIDSEYSAQITNKLGTYMPPDLTQQQFLVHPLVVKPLLDALGGDVQRTKIDLNLSPEVFFEKIHKPKYIAMYNERKRRLLNDGELFDNGEVNEDLGKSYYRSIVVPPLAMSFSLFFGLLNLFAFISTLLALKISPVWLAKLIGSGSLSLIFVAYPLAFPSETVTSKAFSYFQQQLNDEYHPSASIFSAWVVDTQPLIYSTGHLLSEVLGQRAIERWLMPKSSVAGVKSEQAAVSSPKTPVVYQKNQTTNLTSPPSTTTEDIPAKNRDPGTTVTWKRQNRSISEAAAHGVQLLKETLESHAGAMVDIMPISAPREEAWGVYDKTITDADVCLIGKLQHRSLYEITPSTWHSSKLGACDTQNEKIPRLGDYLAYVKHYQKNKKAIIFNLHESLVGEVYCRRYFDLIDTIKLKIGSVPTIWSTPSISVLGCLKQVSDVEHIAFELPTYSGDANNITNTNHKLLSMKEWRRLESVEAGVAITLSTILDAELNLLLKHHPYIDILIIDKRLVSSNVRQILNKKNVDLFIVEGRNIDKENM
tara:strand:+ start:1360 stop:4191 length:2832 start_codon:yes stop_codon:yes gene_type:complete